MRKAFVCARAWTLLGVMLGMVPVVGVYSHASAQNLAATSRVVEGKVFSASGAVQPNAVVYLKDEKTLEIKTYISTEDGTFRFGQLGSQDDYLLWAEFGGHKSKSRTISAFDSKKRFDVLLKIEDK